MTLTKTIDCKREIADGVYCNRPVAPVFGAYPEECTTCASRVLVNTKEGRDATEKILENVYSRLRALAIAGAVSGNVWRVDGLVLRDRFRMVDQLVEQLAIRKLMRSVGIASRLSEQRASVGKTTNEVKHTSLGSRWSAVTADRAIKLRQAGFNTRFIGVGWEVEVS